MYLPSPPASVPTSVLTTAQSALSVSSHPRGTWLYHSPVRLPPSTGFPRPAGVLALQEQVEHVHQQTGFPAHPVCTLRAASSPQNPSLPPATSTATSQKVRLCSCKPAWPWARLQLAQPEPGTGPREALGVYLHSPLQTLPQGRVTVPVPGQ